jgi:tRNA(Arg) A34 adenosine deaminase TadA
MNESYMHEAIRLARDSITHGGGPFGAVIVKAGAIVGRGANCVTVSHDPTAHAEVVAIRDACRQLGTFRLAGCEIYASCEPCPMCLAAIYWARLDRIYYALTRQDAAAMGFDDEFLYRELSLSPAQRQLPLQPLARDAALSIVRDWNSKPDKTPY